MVCDALPAVAQHVLYACATCDACVICAKSCISGQSEYSSLCSLVQARQRLHYILQPNILCVSQILHPLWQLCWAERQAHQFQNRFRPQQHRLQFQPQQPATHECAKSAVSSWEGFASAQDYIPVLLQAISMLLNLTAVTLPWPLVSALQPVAIAGQYTLPDAPPWYSHCAEQ